MNVKTGLILPLLAFVFGSAALAEEPTDYRFPRECTMTPAGYPAHPTMNMSMNVIRITEFQIMARPREWIS